MGNVTDVNRGARRADPMSSADRALRVLILLGEEPWVTVSLVAVRLGVARSTAHRLLNVLQANGFAHQDPQTRAYGPGRALLEAGIGALRRLDSRRAARPVLEALCLEVGETVHLITLEGPRTFVLDSVEPDRPVRVSSRIGGSMPAHTTAAGKALLATMDPEARRALLGPDPLAVRTDATIATHARLDAELAKVQARGYATNAGENEPDLAAVSVEVPAFVDGRRAAITVAAPANRVDPAQIEAMADAAHRAAARVAAAVRG